MAILTLSVIKSGVAQNLGFTSVTDWAKWDGASVTPAQTKNGGGSLISAAIYGSGAATGYINDPRTIYWSGGTPTASGSDVNGTYNNAFIANVGFEVSFPADRSIKRAFYYLGYFDCNATITAIISDASTGNQVDNTTLTGAASTSFNGIVLVTFSANSAGQTMKIRAESGATLGGASPNVTLQAATINTIAVDCPTFLITA